MTTEQTGDGAVERDQDSRLVVGRLEVPKASHLLARTLRDRILGGELDEGSLLPPERELVNQTGLGRASVREALRMLESENLLETRPGRGGGWLVRRPDPEAMVRSLDVFIRGRQISYATLLETREAVEPACAALAAAHRAEDDLAEIEAANQRLLHAADDLPTFLLENVRWHLAVVAATHNELLIGFMSAIADPVHAQSKIEDFHTPEARSAALRAHERITDAIVAGDSEAASRRMHRHVHTYREAVSALSNENELSQTP